MHTKFNTHKQCKLTIYTKSRKWVIIRVILRSLVTWTTAKTSKLNSPKPADWVKTAMAAGSAGTLSLLAAATNSQETEASLVLCHGVTHVYYIIWRLSNLCSVLWLPKLVGPLLSRITWTLLQLLVVLNQVVNANPRVYCIPGTMMLGADTLSMTVVQ